MKTQLEKHIWHWMMNTLSIPRKEFNGHPICPWITKYQDKIYIKEVKQGIKEPILHAVDLLEPLNFAAIVLAFSKKPPIGSIRRVCDETLNIDTNDNIEILINDHRRKGTIRGVYTGYSKCDLVIIQNRRLLKLARIRSKEAGYYKTD